MHKEHTGIMNYLQSLCPPLPLLILDRQRPDVSVIPFKPEDMVLFDHIPAQHPRFHLAILTSGKTLTTTEIQQRLAQARDIRAQQVLALLPENTPINLRALGFSRLLQDPQPGTGTEEAYLLWGYSIFSYRDVPTWLNSSYWANPEQWNKFRW